MKKISLAVMLAGLSANLHAIELLSGFGGDAGFGELAMLANDDDSSNALNLPFGINFFGQEFNRRLVLISLARNSIVFLLTITAISAF